MYYIKYTRKSREMTSPSTYYMAPGRVRDIRVKIGETWRAADEAQKAAYIAYKSREHYYTEIPHTHENGITIFRGRNDPYMATYFKLEGSERNAKHPIIDINDISVFLMDGATGRGSRDGAGWVNARNYQAWAYADFVYDHAVRKCYMSKYSTYLAFPPGFDRANVVTIDIDGLPPNIIFSVSRNDNNSVYYERNDGSHRRFRICDNDTARSGYLGWYTRMTMPIAMSFSYENVVYNSLVLPTQQTEITNVEEDQCILCYKNKKNIKFIPCQHLVICASCYPKLTKSTECIICKNTIIELQQI